MDAQTKRFTVPMLRERKSGPRIAAITAYDFSMARLFDAAGIDLILVGDSAATVIQGETTTIPATLEQMIYHSRCVSRGVQSALVVGDLPFLSYQISVSQAIESAGRLVKEGGVSAVKLEGGIPFAETVRRLVEIDIPVVGHVGLTPQSYHRMGGHRLQGQARSDSLGAGSYERVKEDALALADAGVCALVIEGVPAELAREITSAVPCPTIGIGAGPHCDGQILVSYDMLGLIPDFKPRFVKRYAELGAAADEALRRYVTEVRDGSFPAAENYVSRPQSAVLPH